jgi:hypothetical protein
MDKFTEALTELIKTTVTADIKATIIKDALPDISADVQEYACETASNEARHYLKYELDLSDEVSSAVDNWMDYNLDVSDKVDDYMQNADFDTILINFFASASGRAVLLDTIREGLKKND